MNPVEEEEDEELKSMAPPETTSHRSMNSNGYGPDKIEKVSSLTSIDSMGEEPYLSDYVQSDDLDKLSMCLSEVSSETSDAKKSSLFNDILQAQLALWTLIISIFYSYAWQQHRKKFLFSIFVMIPLMTVVCCTMSWLLTAIVILGRLFSTPLRFQDILKFGCSVQEDEAQSTFGRSVGSVRNRRRSTSGDSIHSTVSGRSSSCEELPKPVCRKHSTSHWGSRGSLNLVCGTPTTASYTGQGSTSNGFNGFHHSNGLNGRSVSMCGVSPRNLHNGRAATMSVVKSVAMTTGSDFTVTRHQHAD